ncbi:hypothetical protein TSACC_21687 [Terrimicrobium sacchariphilum]|uniref:Uncharacterized protein n=1 Tax=Terrimicrobium sacchariphilum TaxID=690879 RepID=A0A146G8Q8_TERSA|nr:hypothetical protein [Terrimicrobium sacchariphilum]GAT33274.1 hypothetical protein TSACC_21687 [Terrimicrobium sacchariphilum]
MKIQYLNPENAPTPPDGWRWKTALCKPETINDWRVWRDNFSYYCDRFRYDGSVFEWTYITQADLPADYYFDFDGTGLNFDDPFYRRGVMWAAKEGKTIQVLHHDGSPWENCSPSWNWKYHSYRIHPRHAADYGLEVPGDKEPTIPANLPPFPPSPKPGHHLEYRTPAQAKGKLGIWYCFGGGLKDWTECGRLSSPLNGNEPHYAELVPDTPTEQLKNESQIMNQITLKLLLESIHESTALSTPEELKKACVLIERVQGMNSAERDVIRATFRKGPLFDGDVPSKSGRDSLLSDGFVAKVVVKGEDGYNACTYKGRKAYRLIEAGA